MKHTLSVLVENESGVLTRIAGLFAREALILKVFQLVQQNKKIYLVLLWLFQVMIKLLNN
jgi:acetolactate synthase small subunit